MQTHDISAEQKDRVRQVIESTGVSMRKASTEWLGRNPTFLEQALRLKRPLTDPELRGIATGASAAGAPIDVDWLKTGREKPAPFAGPRDLPVKTAFSVGSFVAPPLAEEHIERPAMLVGVERSFAIRIHDDRLKPRYRRNDVLYFHGGQAPEVEDCVAIELQNGRHIVGIFVQSGREGIVLKSLTPEQYETYKGALSISREVGVLRG